MRREEGFTLVEVIVSMLLMSLIVMGMGMLPLTIQRSRTSYENRQIAENLAQNIIEQYLNEPYNSIASMGPDEWNNSGITNNGVTFIWRVQVTGYDVTTSTHSINDILTQDEATPQVKRVVVSVALMAGSISPVCQKEVLIRG